MNANHSDLGSIVHKLVNGACIVCGQARAEILAATPAELHALITSSQSGRAEYVAYCGCDLAANHDESDRPIVSAPQSLQIRADELRPGDILTRAGKTAYAGSQAITVTRTITTDLFSGAIVAVYGYTLRNSEPRLMFRGLRVHLPVSVVRS